MHRRRRETFLRNNLDTTAGSIRKHNITANTIYAAGRSWGQVLVFVLLGVLLFVRPIAIEQNVVTGFVLTLLF
jgi:putative ATP-binding cassette transporter